ncbi:MAG: NTP transferase domain-containing protein, partial [Anaerolineae bacterium]|nr:NTP transferase domain-containing protein [Anaerolineae bacterium]
MKAVIMAGGRGTRLAPFTKVLPKPLIPLGDYPIVEIIMCQLREAGFTEVTLAVNYLAHLFQAYFNNGERLGIHIDYSIESEPLGTAGPLTLVEGLDEPFLLMNADLVTDMDFADLYDYHLRNNSAITMALYPREVRIDFGVIELDAESRIQQCREKPTYEYLVNMGIYVVSPEVLQYLPYGQHYDFTDLVDLVRSRGHNVYGYVFQGEWMDLGRVDDFTKATEHYEHLAAIAERRIPLETVFALPE